MTDFADFYKELRQLISKHDMPLKIDADLDSQIIKIFGQEFTSLSRAKSGLDDLTEMSLTSAEHHPYWNILSQCCTICQVILDKWNGELTESEIQEIQWCIRELQHASKKFES